MLKQLYSNFANLFFVNSYHGEDDDIQGVCGGGDDEDGWDESVELVVVRVEGGLRR